VRADADALTYSVGAVWHLTADKTYSLYANANTAFQPDFNVNPDGSGRDPNTGNQKEVGLKFNPFGGKIQGTLAYFDLVSNSNVTDPDRLGYTIRQDGAKSRGYELNVSTNITRQWYLMAGGARTEAFLADGVTPIDLQPKYKFSTFTSYKFDKGTLNGLNVNLGAIYTGERPLTNSTARGETDWGPAPGYWRLDAIIGYKIHPSESRFAWNVSVKVANLLDEQDGYYVIAYHRYTINAGRTWQAVVGVKF
jgi:iron complex outermembrane recepter protein